MQHVAEQDYEVPIIRRTGGRAIRVERAALRAQRGRGFVLQGNNDGWGRPPVQHAIYVDRVRGGTPGVPEHALVFDPQRPGGPVWMRWARLLAFGSRLRMNDAGDLVAPGFLYAAFGPRRSRKPPPQGPAPPPDPGTGARPRSGATQPVVTLRFGAVALPRAKRFRAAPPPGRSVNVRDTPKSMALRRVVDFLDAGDVFVSYQRVDDGAQPSPGASHRWFGDLTGENWVHRSGIRGLVEDAQPGPIQGGEEGLEGVGDPDDPDPQEAPEDVLVDDGAPPPPDQPDRVANESLADSQADPSLRADGSDAFPDDEDADFVGRELSDAELDDLPVVDD